MGGAGLGDGAQGATEVRFKEGAGVLGVRAIGHAGERHGGNLGSVSSPGKKVGDDGWGLVGSESDGACGLRESGNDKRGPGCQRAQLLGRLGGGRTGPVGFLGRVSVGFGLVPFLFLPLFLFLFYF